MNDDRDDDDGEAIALSLLTHFLEPKASELEWLVS